MSENMELLEKSVVSFSSRREARLSVHVLRPLESRYTVPQSGICGMTNGRGGNIQLLGEKRTSPAATLSAIYFTSILFGSPQSRLLFGS